MPNKEFDIKYFSGLARIDLTPEEEERFTKDLNEVLDHFKELEAVDTSKVSPMAGGTRLPNISSEDELGLKVGAVPLRGQFPDEKDGLLRVPKVFD